MGSMRKVVVMWITACMAVLIMPQYCVSASEAGNQNGHGVIASASDSDKDQDAGEMDGRDGMDGMDEPDEVDEIENRDDAISVDVPIISQSGRSPFDFIMDPQGLICRTDAARYGGEQFEEGATLYFKNTGGDYDYSSQSDWIEVVNKSSVPVNVTIEAVVKNLSTVELTEDSDFEDDNKTAAICLELVDDNGNVIPLDSSGNATVDVEIDASEDTYSFGLTGACNPHGNWEGIDETPQVVISWTIVPLSNSEYESLILDLDEIDMTLEDTDATPSDGKQDDAGQKQDGLTETDVSESDTAKEPEPTRETGQPGEPEPTKETGQPGEPEPTKEAGQPGEPEPSKEAGQSGTAETDRESEQEKETKPVRETEQEKIRETEQPREPEKSEVSEPAREAAENDI